MDRWRPLKEDRRVLPLSAFQSLLLPITGVMSLAQVIKPRVEVSLSLSLHDVHYFTVEWDWEERQQQEEAE